MKYVSPSEARNLPGLRLVLSAGVPGPWGEAAKSVLEARSVPYVPVMQRLMEANADLVEWTGVRNAPVAIYENEAPINSWLDILFLSERLGSGPSLLPLDSRQRAECIGISHEICGKMGLGWSRRLVTFGGMIAAAGGDMAKTPIALEILGAYGAKEQTIAAAPKRCVDILEMLTLRLKQQQSRGSPYLVGERFSACDIYWTCFSGMFNPLPHEMNPCPDYIRQLYTNTGPIIGKALSPILFEHRDFIYQTHLKLPLDF